ncbi:MAG: PriCT-2 domain-containing protein [Planctomycetes bacterium]|nr:PriCT-2 domain-containing protein [Planctomycetota bacterium]
MRDADSRTTALDALEKLAGWRADDRDQWLKAGMSLHSASPDLLPAWDQWSQQSEKYKPGECQRQWRGFKSDGGVGLGSLIRMAQQDSGDSSFGSAVATASPPPPKSGVKVGVKSKDGKTYPTRDDAIRAAARQIGGKPVDGWEYHHADGGSAFWICRFDLPTTGADGKPDKQFRPIHQASDGWKVADPPGKLPLYRLLKLNGAERAYIFEGEKCVDAAAALGLNAATSSHGARSAKKTDWSPLAGREVVLWPDNDRDGEKYVNEVAAILAELELPARVKIVRLPDLPAKGDIADHIESRDSATSEEIRAYIEDLADKAALVLPSPDKLPEPPRPAWITLAAILDGPSYRRGLKVISTGFECLDRVLGGGFVAGAVHIIAGRTGSAKSMLITNMARLMGLNQSSVLLFALEDGPQLAVWRMHSACANVPLRVLLDGATGHGPGIDALRESAGIIRDLPVKLTDVRELADIVRTVELHASDGGEIVLLDQISKVRTSGLPNAASTYERVSEISESLRLAALRHNLPIVSVCQVNRKASMGKDDLEISDLRDSGMLEQDAVSVLLLDKAADAPTVEGQSPQFCKLLPVKVGKNRFGPAGQKVELIWYPRISRIDDDPNFVNSMGVPF